MHPAQIQSDPPETTYLTPVVPLALSGLVIVIALVVLLVGYGAGFEMAIHVHPSLPGMAMSTAICLFLIAGGVLMTCVRSQAPVRIVRGVAALSGFIALSNIALVLSGVSSGIEKPLLQIGGFEHGIMSAATSVCEILAASALWLAAGGTLTSGQARVFSGLVNCLLLVAGAGGVAYVFHWEETVPIAAFSQMAPHTAASLFCLGVALVLAWPHYSWASVLTAKTNAAQAARKLFPIYLLMPTAISYLVVSLGTTALFGPLLSAIAVLFTVFLIALMVRNTRYNSATEQQLQQALDQLEQESRTSKALQQAVSQMREAVVLYDAEDRLVFCNDQYRKLYPRSAPAMEPGIEFRDLLKFGLSKGEYSDAVGREDQWLVERLAAHNSPSSELEQHLSNDRWLLVREHELEDGGRIGFRLDITDRKQLEATLEAKTARAEQAVQAKDRFLTTMSHELRTPMNGVLGMAQALQQTDLQDRQRDMLDVVVEAGGRLMRLLNDLLDFAAMETGEMALEQAPFMVSDLIERQAMLFRQTAHDRGLTLTVETNGIEGLQLYGDDDRIGQVLSNLLSNAIKFSGPGDVTVSVGAQPSDQSGHSLLDIKVADRGPGVSEDQRTLIFGRFEQTDIGKQQGGAGLGLAICRTICALHGGQITCHARPGGGSVFHVRLELKNGPDMKRKSPGTEAMTTAQTEERQAPHCLIADDNDLNQRVLEAFLSQWDAQVVMASDGAEAIEKFSQSSFDIVFMDISMPGMSGVEAIHAIRDLEQQQGGGKTSIIACSAHVMDEQVESFLQAGADGHLGKPIDLASLNQIMADLTEEQARKSA
ncbi:MAG: hypothetical protein Alpg2KO_27300 [Alphaproteobacteria bacterium]